MLIWNTVIVCNWIENSENSCIILSFLCAWRARAANDDCVLRWIEIAHYWRTTNSPHIGSVAGREWAVRFITVFLLLLFLLLFVLSAMGLVKMKLEMCMNIELTAWIMSHWTDRFKYIEMHYCCLGIMWPIAKFIMLGSSNLATLFSFNHSESILIFHFVSILKVVANLSMNV